MGQSRKGDDVANGATLAEGHVVVRTRGMEKALQRTEELTASAKEAVNTLGKLSNLKLGSGFSNATREARREVNDLTGSLAALSGRSAEAFNTAGVSAYRAEVQKAAAAARTLVGGRAPQQGPRLSTGLGVTSAREASSELEKKLKQVEAASKNAFNTTYPDRYTASVGRGRSEVENLRRSLRGLSQDSKSINRIKVDSSGTSGGGRRGGSSFGAGLQGGVLAYLLGGSQAATIGATLGGAVGEAAGPAVGKGIGAALGTAAGPIGRIAGAKLGEELGSAAGGPLGAALGAAVATSLTQASAYQRLETQLQVLIGSQEQSIALADDLISRGSASPLPVQEYVTAARRLLATGESLETVLDTVDMLAKISFVTDGGLGELSYIFAQSRAEGKLLTRDLRQFATQGFPIYKELGETLGKTRSEIEALTEAGQISFADLERTFVRAAGEGGRFADSLTLGAKDLQGASTRSIEIVKLIASDLGKATDEALQLTEALNLVASGLGYVRKVTAVGKPIAATISDIGGAQTRSAAKGFQLIGERLRELGESWGLSAPQSEDLANYDRMVKSLEQVREEIIATQREQERLLDLLAKGKKNRREEPGENLTKVERAQFLQQRFLAEEKERTAELAQQKKLSDKIIDAIAEGQTRLARLKKTGTLEDGLVGDGRDAVDALRAAGKLEEAAGLEANVNILAAINKETKEAEDGFKSVADAAEDFKKAIEDIRDQQKLDGFNAKRLRDGLPALTAEQFRLQGTDEGRAALAQAQAARENREAAEREAEATKEIERIRRQILQLQREGKAEAEDIARLRESNPAKADELKADRERLDAQNRIADALREQEELERRIAALSKGIQPEDRDIAELRKDAGLLQADAIANSRKEDKRLTEELNKREATIERLRNGLRKPLDDAKDAVDAIRNASLNGTITDAEKAQLYSSQAKALIPDNTPRPELTNYSSLVNGLQEKILGKEDKDQKKAAEALEYLKEQAAADGLKVRIDGSVVAVAG